MVGSRLPFLDGDGESKVVLPDAVDLEEALGEALAPDVEFLDDPPAVGVARNDADLEPMELQLLEGEAHEHGYRLGDVGLTGTLAVDPVTHGCALQRATRDVVEIDFAGQLIVDEHAERVGV